MSTADNLTKQLKNKSVTRNVERVFVLPELELSGRLKKYQNGDFYEIIDNGYCLKSTSFNKNGLNPVNSAKLVQFDQYSAAFLR